jgi:hypothetical protein
MSDKVDSDKVVVKTLAELKQEKVENVCVLLAFKWQGSVLGIANQ